MSEKENRYYFLFLGITFFLLIVGIYMVYSSSFPISIKVHKSMDYFLKKQLIFAAIGVVVMFIASKVDYKVYRDIAYPLLIVSGILILLTYFPHIGKTVKGAHRWIGLGGINIQPSEITKVFMIMFMAYLLDKKREKMDSFAFGFLPFIIIPGIIMGLVAMQPDFGTFLLMALLIYIMMFIGGVRVKYLVGGLLCLLPVIYFAIVNSPYRLARMLVFLDPWKYYKAKGYQVAQSLISFGAGGLFGKGIGASQQKLYFLPEAYTDYIFAIFAEELGFIGVFIVIFAFVLFLITGIKMSLKVYNRFGRLLGIGLTILIVLQAFINFSVCMGILPPKGITLPFFSYGGSSLISTLFAVGILLNISKDIENV